MLLFGFIFATIAHLTTALPEMTSKRPLNVLEARAANDFSECVASFTAPYQDCYNAVMAIEFSAQTLYESGVPLRVANYQVTYINRGHGGTLDRGNMGNFAFDILGSCWTQSQKKQNFASAGTYTFQEGDSTAGIVCMGVNGSPCPF
ncbi:hypothetical protein F5884DRAFT_752212 [Xylogone sp. PMI_703]|nr:hypothetical protein F5884DRAFT_752212 [Xylogone sp. PMI_703]